MSAPEEPKPYLTEQSPDATSPIDADAILPADDGDGGDDPDGAPPVAAGAGAGADPAAAPAASEEAAIDEKRMSLLEHLSELRVRLRNAAIAFFLSMVASFFFVQRFFEVLTRPVRRGMIMAGFDSTLNVKGVTEPFWVYMKLAITAGIIIASPFVFWEMWKFVAPGLYKKEKKLAGFVTGATAVCFAGGALFGYLVLSEPAAYYMMSLLKVENFPSPVPFDLRPQLMMDDVAGFLMLTLAGCGVAFELPVVIALLGALGIVSKAGLWKFNKYALVLSTVMGAVLTPSTDPFTQLLLAGPLFLLYNVSILIVWGIERARKRKEEDLERQYAEGSGDGA